MRKFRRTTPRDESDRVLQDNIADALAPLTDVPLLDYVWRRDVTLASGSNQVPHGLGRAWRGCIVTRQNAAATISQPDTQPLRERFLTLQATANVVVDLYLF
jgi:hypothetical protein